jgi:hypothetical protein
MSVFEKLVKSITIKEKEAILLVGPGVARDAGLHTGWDLMLKTAGLVYISETDRIDPDMNLEQWFLSSKYANMKYAEVLSKIAPTRANQVNFLHNYLDHKDISPIYKGIAELVARRIFAAVISVNFDHYLEKALATHRIQLQEVAADEDIPGLVPLAHTNTARLYKPYGDIERGEIKNTPADIASLSPLMEKELINIITEHTLIILGYSGGHDPGMQRVFKGRGFSYHQLFYVNPRPAVGQMADILQTKDYVYVPYTGASKFIEDVISLLEKI